MSKIPLVFLTLIFFSSCSNVTTGFEMIGEFKDGVYKNDFSIDSRYWPSFVMVIPEHTDLEDNKFEAVAIFTDYGIMNEQNPVGYNISHFTQKGINAQRKTIFAIEDKDNLSLYLDDANTESVAYSTYDSDLDLYEYFIQSIDGGESKLVASGDPDKLNSYSSVVGDRIYWMEIKGDGFEILSDAVEGSKEVLLSYDNGYAVLMESNGDYIVFYVEEYDEDYNLVSNDILVYDVVNDQVSKTVDLDSNYEVTAGNYDGNYFFITAYDYGTEEYFYARVNRAGAISELERAESNDFTCTGAGDRYMMLSALSGQRSSFYEADLVDLATSKSEYFTDLLNAGFYNNYLFYVECDVNSSYLIDNLTLTISKAK